MMVRGAGLREISRQAADIAVQIAVAESAGNLQKAARVLGVTDRTLQLRSSRRAGSAGVQGIASYLN
jgi:transcriptional regulator with GAF, ATPase, and Fis domain